MDGNTKMKVGALVTVYNCERFIQAHLEMLAKQVDKIVVVFQQTSCPVHLKEHGATSVKDRTEEIARSFKFKEIEYYDTFLTQENFEKLNNDGSKYLMDCDVITRLDQDMFFTDKDFERFIRLLRENKADQYRLNFKKYSINYYVTDRFDRGLKEALELREIIAFSPHVGYSFGGTGRQFLIEWDDFILHHFRGWKPSTTNESIEKYHQEHPEYGDWVTAPLEIINKLQ